MDWAREMSVQLRMLAALPEDKDSISSSNGNSQLSLTPVPGNLILSSGLSGQQPCTWYTSIRVEKNTHTHK